jgi:hypothetical protein
MAAITEYREERHAFGEAGLPSHPPPGVMWVFMEGDTPVAVNFLCPCGCGAECYTPLEGPRPHKWAYSKGPNGGPTLSPSIRYLGGCKAHFNIEDGKSIIHGDSGK